MTDAAPKGGLILVVDDEPAILDLLRTQLEFAEYRVVTAANGREGVAQLEAHAGELGLLVLDAKCPGTHDARDVLTAREKLRDDLPVLVVSGDLQEEAYEQLAWPRSGAAFACDFLHKPYHVTALEAKVAALLQA